MIGIGAQLARAGRQFPPLRVVIGDVVYVLVSIDDSPVFLDGNPVYMEIDNG